MMSCLSANRIFIVFTLLWFLYMYVDALMQ
ncbi:Uncharacterised protein [Segatella copri]|nr:Uncharacterised protein [Segatella copri]